METLELTVIQHLIHNGRAAIYEVINNGEVIDVESYWDDAKAYCKKLAYQYNVSVTITLVW